jgi:hypothetical protein
VELGDVDETANPFKPWRGGGRRYPYPIHFWDLDGNYEYRKNRDKMKPVVERPKDHPSITGIFFKILTMEIVGIFVGNSMGIQFSC